MVNRKTADIFNYGLQVVLWLIFILVPLYMNRQRDEFWTSHAMTQFVVQHLLFLVLFYVNYFYLIPNILPQRGIWMYLLLVLLFFALILFGLPLFSLLISGGKSGYKFSWGMLAPVIQVYAVSSSWKLLYEYFKQRLRERTLQMAKRESELKFLRSQINPHFLFNTLNNINSLIRSKPEQAEKSVVRLSNLMRYMLRTGDQPRVPLKDEFDYLLNYIELQKLRLHSDFDLKVVIPESGADLEIEPLLLVSFIENCFKHGVHGESHDFIEISVKLNQNILQLQTRNRIDINSSSREISSGIGLQNVSQRLELCYENKYDLEVVETSGVFVVNLQLELI